MGADTFYQYGNGDTAEQAFQNAYEDACYEYGHGGYSGSLAEKDSFVMIDCPEDEDPERFAERLIHDGDDRIDDKWGPAGCIDCGRGTYLFFGWASY